MRKVFPVLALLVFAAAPARSAPLRVNPQFVIDRILSQGRDARTIELDRLKADSFVYQARAAYDWIFSGNASYENSRAQFLSGGGNLQDKTSIWAASMEKRIPTGTIFKLTFSRTLQDSIFRPNTTSSSSRSPYAVFDDAELALTQDLLGNFFGLAERRANHAAEQAVEAAELNKKDQLESLVLSSLQQFWNAYVAKESLRDAIQQRDKYEALVKEIEGKARRGFVNPGDLPKARAEYGAQVRNVKTASFNYIDAVDKLFTAMRIEAPAEAIEFQVDEELPPMPMMVAQSVDRLRAVESADLAFQAASETKRAADLSSLPSLQLVGKANYTGLEPTQSKAFATLTDGAHPKYSIGLLLSYRFFSDKTRTDQNDANVGYEKALNTLLKAKEDQTRILKTSMEQVRLSYAAAASAIDEAKNWAETVKEQERSYRQGRLDFSQLIQDYDSFYRSRSTRIRAIGDYHIAINAFAAANDRLVE